MVGVAEIEMGLGHLRALACSIEPERHFVPPSVVPLMGEQGHQSAQDPQSPTMAEASHQRAQKQA